MIGHTDEQARRKLCPVAADRVGRRLHCCGKDCMVFLPVSFAGAGKRDNPDNLYRCGMARP